MFLSRINQAWCSCAKVSFLTKPARPRLLWTPCYVLVAMLDCNSFRTADTLPPNNELCFAVVRYVLSRFKVKPPRSLPVPLSHTRQEEVREWQTLEKRRRITGVSSSQVQTLETRFYLWDIYAVASNFKCYFRRCYPYEGPEPEQTTCPPPIS